MKRKLLSIAALLCGVLLVVSHGARSEELLIMGYDSGPPKYYVENGEQKGLVVDLVRWVLDDMDRPHRMELVPWKRAYTSALRGNSGVIGLSMNSERLEIFDYSDPLFSEDLMVIVKKGREFPFETVEDLKGKVVAVGRGASYGDEYDEAVEEGVFEVSSFTRPAHGLRMMLAERVDALLLGPGKYGLKRVLEADGELQMHQFSILPVPFKRDAKYLGFHKSREMKPFFEKFNKALKKARDSGVVDELLESYYQ